MVVRWSGRADSGLGVPRLRACFGGSNQKPDQASHVVWVLRLVGSRLHRSDQLGLGLANLELLEPCRGLGAVRRAELRASIREMTRDGVLAKAQALGDVTVRSASRRELYYLKLALGQAGPPSFFRDDAGSPTKFIVAAGGASEDLARSRCSQRPQSLRRCEPRP